MKVTESMRRLETELKGSKYDLSYKVSLVPAGYYMNDNNLYGWIGSCGFDDSNGSNKKGDAQTPNMEHLSYYDEKYLTLEITFRSEKISDQLNLPKNREGGCGKQLKAYTFFISESENALYKKQGFDKAYEEYKILYPMVTEKEFAGFRDNGFRDNEGLVEERLYMNDEDCLWVKPPQHRITIELISLDIDKEIEILKSLLLSQ